MHPGLIIGVEKQTSYAAGPGPSSFNSLNLLSLVTISPPLLVMVSFVLYAPGPK